MRGSWLILASFAALLATLASEPWARAQQGPRQGTPAMPPAKMIPAPNSGANGPVIASPNCNSKWDTPCEQRPVCREARNEFWRKERDVQDKLRAFEGELSGILETVLKAKPSFLRDLESLDGELDVLGKLGTAAVETGKFPSARLIAYVAALQKINTERRKLDEANRTTPNDRTAIKTAQDAYYKALRDAEPSASAVAGFPAELQATLEALKVINSNVAKIEGSFKQLGLDEYSKSDRTQLGKKQKELRDAEGSRDAAKDRACTAGATEADLYPAASAPGEQTQPPAGTIRIHTAWYGRLSAVKELSKAMPPAGTVLKGACDAEGYVRLACEYVIYEVCDTGDGEPKPLPKCANANHKVGELPKESLRSVCSVPVTWNRMCGGYNPDPYHDRYLLVTYSCGGAKFQAEPARDGEKLFLVCEKG
jgi:hypothetical protein